MRHVLLLSFLILASSFCLSNELPNDCAITATEAYARLGTSAVWSQILFVRFIDIETFRVFGHTFAVWQIHKDGAILIYDESGAIPLDTHSHEPNDIAAALNKLNPSQPIFRAQFIQ